MMAFGTGNVNAQELQTCECMQGDTITLTYEFFDSEGNPLDLRRTKMKLFICPYGQYKDPALVKEGIISDANPNTFVVNLDVNDTVDFDYVKYTQQPVIMLDDGREYRKAQGDILFYSRISPIE